MLPLPEQGDDLGLGRIAAFAFFREDELPVDYDVELAPLAWHVHAGVLTCRADRGRETRSPDVVPASDGAVEDIDLHGCQAYPAGGAEQRPGA